MVFWEHKTELVCFLSITEETKVLVNAVDYDVWEAKYERAVSFIDGVKSWDLPCL